MQGIPRFRRLAARLAAGLVVSAALGAGVVASAASRALAGDAPGLDAFSKRQHIPGYRPAPRRALGQPLASPYYFVNRPRSVSEGGIDPKRARARLEKRRSSAAQLLRRPQLPAGVRIIER